MNHDLFTEGEDYKLKTIKNLLKDVWGLKNFQEKNDKYSHALSMYSVVRKYQYKTSIENENQNSNNEDSDEFDDKQVHEGRTCNLLTPLIETLSLLKIINWSSRSLR